MYFNLKREGSNIKGEVAEVIVKNKLYNCFRTRENSSGMLSNLKFKIKPEIKTFLEEHWYSLDLFRFVLNEDKSEAINLELFEVKAQNYYSKKLSRVCYLLKSTGNTLDLYSQAKEMGFIVKVAKVIFFDNWRYLIQIKDFSLEDFNRNDGSLKYIQEHIIKKFKD